MICSRCLRRSVPSRFIRPFSSTYLLSQTPPSSTPASPRTKGPPTVTSTGAAQPFSTPLSPSPTALGITSHPAKKTTTPLPVSSAPEGTVLKGINYIKGHNDPVALKEEDYPEWLWHCLDVSKKTAEEDAAGDEFSKSKKVRQKAAKAKRRAEERAIASGDTSILEPKIPITQQTIDLAAEGPEALQQREELRKAMRRERRAAIKEKNYLKTM
ncbi:ribosomal L37 protein [Rutstroemia sp. NJR-2017a BBW]|nr:ribosomal L37 protein [Rutstroemia sp. NJR-2017a BBW]